jgi:hypothetical protein
MLKQNVQPSPTLAKIQVRWVGSKRQIIFFILFYTQINAKKEIGKSPSKKKKIGKSNLFYTYMTIHI